MSSDDPDAIRIVLGQIIMNGSVRDTKDEFLVEADMEGESAKELNRLFLSRLRRVEKRTRLRAEWTSEDGTVYRFFDYVLKKTKGNT